MLLADEPTGNLDSRTSLEVVEIFQRLNTRQGLTIMLVTHERDIAQYARRLVSFLDGRVRADEPIVSQRSASVDLAALTADDQMRLLSAWKESVGCREPHMSHRTRVAHMFNHWAKTSTVDPHGRTYCRLSGILCVVVVTVGLVTRATLGAQRGDPPLVLESMVSGDLYQFSCGSCHGRTGKGDGPAAPALKTPPPDLTALARQNDGAFPRDRVRAVLTGPFRSIPAHGSSDMPIWGPVFRALDPSEPRVRVRIESLVAYLESLQEPSSAPQDRGARLFRTYCASCHGSTARGDGPVAPELRRPPPDLTRFTENNGGVFPTNRVFDIIDGRDVRAHGDRDMPVWGDAFRSGPDGLTDEAVKTRIDAIAAYLRAIQRREAD